MDFKFNKSVLQNSILNKNILFKDFWWMRIDLPAKIIKDIWETDLFEYFPGSQTNNYSFLNNNKTVRCSLITNENMKIPKMQHFSIFLKGGYGGVESTSSEILKNDFFASGVTEDAKLTLTLESIKVNEDKDDFEFSNCEIYYFYLHCIDKPNNIHEPKISKGPTGSINWHSCPIGDWKTVNYKLFDEIIGWRDNMKEINFGISFWENDSDYPSLAYPPIYNIVISGLYNQHEIENGPPHSCTESWIRGYIVDNYSGKGDDPNYVMYDDVMGAAVCGGSSDENHLSVYNRWGCVPFNPRILQRGNNTMDFKLKYELK